MYKHKKKSAKDETKSSVKIVSNQKNTSETNFDDSSDKNKNLAQLQAIANQFLDNKKSLVEKETNSTSNDTIQRIVMDGEGEEMDLNGIYEALDEDDELLNSIISKYGKGGWKKAVLSAFELEQKTHGDREIDLANFLINHNLLSEEEEDIDMEDEEWDPSEHAAEPMVSDDVISGEVRKSLSFTSDAKKLMKIDTPQDKSGKYLCHICNNSIEKGEKVDMDHLPPWKERLGAFISAKNLTQDDYDEVSGPNMKLLYNMRGSVFAHSSCNRGHSGEGNYKKKWGNALNWFNKGGGSPFI